MGYYINPVDESKESWLHKNAFPVTRTDARLFDVHGLREHGFVLLALVENGAFRALAVLHSDQEQDEFLDPNDSRSISYYVSEHGIVRRLIPDLP